MAQQSIADRFTELVFQEKNVKIYSDFTMNMDPHPDTGDLFRITNENAVKSAIKNIVFTNTYERFYNPGLGGNIIKDLFEQLTFETLYAFQSLLTNAIQNNEKRANIVSVVVVPTPNTAQSIDITITFNLINITSDPQVLVLSVTKVR